MPRSISGSSSPDSSLRPLPEEIELRTLPAASQQARIANVRRAVEQHRLLEQREHKPLNGRVKHRLLNVLTRLIDFIQYTFLSLFTGFVERKTKEDSYCECTFDPQNPSPALAKKMNSMQNFQKYFDTKLDQATVEYVNKFKDSITEITAQAISETSPEEKAHWCQNVINSGYVNHVLNPNGDTNITATSDGTTLSLKTSVLRTLHDKEYLVDYVGNHPQKEEPYITLTLSPDKLYQLLSAVLLQRLADITDLLEKEMSTEIPKPDLTHSEWKLLDELKLMYFQEYLVDLKDVLNSEELESSTLFSILKDHFGIDYCESHIAETLSMYFAYVEGLDGKKISIPRFDADLQTYKMVEYSIEQSYLGDALPCYFLTSEAKGVEPMMVIRGTSSNFSTMPEEDSSENVKHKEVREGSFESLVADTIDPYGITYNVLNKSFYHQPIVRREGRLVQVPSLKERMDQFKRDEKKVQICGHSLGGTLGISIAIEFPDAVGRSFAFSSPGVSDLDKKKFDDLKSTRKESEMPEVICFDYEGDLIPSGGWNLIGKHFALASLDESTQFSFPDLHLAHITSLFNRSFKITIVDTDYENRKWERKASEGLRRVTNLFVGIYRRSFYKGYSPGWWEHRKAYRNLKNNRDH